MYNMIWKQGELPFGLFLSNLVAVKGKYNYELDTMELVWFVLHCRLN